MCRLCRFTHILRSTATQYVLCLSDRDWLHEIHVNDSTASAVDSSSPTGGTQPSSLPFGDDLCHSWHRQTAGTRYSHAQSEKPHWFIMADVTSCLSDHSRQFQTYSKWDRGTAWLVNMADTSGAAVKTSGSVRFRVKQLYFLPTQCRQCPGDAIRDLRQHAY